MHCPSCGVNLVEYELSAANPMRVEVCDQCSGVWLEHDELTRAQAGHQVVDARRAIEADRTWGNWIFQFILSLPVEFNVRPRRSPWVTYLLIATNCAVFLGLTSMSPTNSVETLAIYPDRLGQSQWLLSLISHQFVHANVFHLLANLYFLWILGDNVEDLLGRSRFLAFYLTAGALGGLAYSLLGSALDVAMVGASGSVSGVIGAYAVLFRRSKLTFMLFVIQFKLSAPIYVSIWVALNLVGYVMQAPGIAWSAHLGGLLLGVAVAGLSYQALLRDRPLLRLLNDVRLPLPQRGA